MKPICEEIMAWFGSEADDLTWISDHEIAYVERQNYDNHGWFSDLRLFDINTKKSVQLLERVVNIITPLREKPGTLVLLERSKGNELYSIKFDVYPRKSYDPVKLSIGHSLFDRNGVDRIVIYDSGDE